MRACKTCGRGLPEQKGPGRPRVYCSAACRIAAYSRAKEPRPPRPPNPPRAARLLIPCRECEAEFRPSHGAQVYCTPKCRHRYQYAHRPHYSPATEQRKCPVCHGLFTAIKAQATKMCSRKCAGFAQRGKPRLLTRKHPPRECEQCGNEFWRRSLGHPKDAGRFCSRPCSFEHKRLSRPKPKPRVYHLQCVECSVGFSAPSRDRKYCGGLCRTLNANRQKRERKLERERVRQRRASAQREPRRCAKCERLFVSRRPRRFCGAACTRKADREKRKMRQRRAFVEHVDVLYLIHRDAQRCALCGKKVMPDKVVPHPRAPTVDHIVPLSRGGKHEKTNVQLACFLCNSKKGNQSHGEQLLCVG